MLIAAGLICLTCGLALAEEKTQAADAKAAGEKSAGESGAARKTQTVSYTTEIVVPAAPATPATEGQKETKEERDLRDELVKEMESNSQLIWLENEEPESRVGLERRVLADVDTAGKLLRSRGYYEGRVSYKIDWSRRPAVARLELHPGPRSVIGQTSIRYQGLPADALADETVFPRSLEAFGLKKGDPAQAADVLQSVNAISAHLERHGYPQSQVLDTRYTVFAASRSLDASVRVQPGPFLRMGPLEVEGAEGVKRHYLESLVTWEEGEIWNADRVRDYQTALQETGLFRSIVLRPGLLEPGTEEQTEGLEGQAGAPKAPEGTGAKNAAQEASAEKIPTGAKNAPQEASAENAPGETVAKKAMDSNLSPVLARLTEAPARTVSAGMSYSTDYGAGIRLGWEHRNLFGGGERLRVFAPINQKLQMLGANFRKPAFGHRDQALVAEAEARNESTDAYDLTALYLAAGIERRLSGDWRNWWVSARVSVEGGTLDDSNGHQSYNLLGLPLSLRRDTTDDIFNPTRGTRLSLSVTPYTGSYEGTLTTVRARLDMSGYLSLGERTVLAARFATGSLALDDVEQAPSPLRFFSGGGGSVRGYKFQNIGPLDKDDDPLGGLSFNEISLEARIRVGENFGIVPFVDAGMVYASRLPDLGKELRWGTGLGFRYYTPIGPIRLDIGVPLQDKGKNDDFQIYFSIGQAF